ncbi:MAG: hypothetical protein FWC66_07780 [Oscillospiraceae bacterium]|nr:hypothetical protein [Oscillospiraceae bacterium]
MDALGDISLEDWVAKQEAALDNLSDSWGVSADSIMAEMQAYGLTMDEWSAKQETALYDLAAHWGTSTDIIKAEMQDLGMSMEEWMGHRQMQMLGDIGAQFGKTADEVVTSLERQGVSMDKITDMYPALAEATIGAALSIDQLMQAYDAAFESALSSINSQIGLFDRLNFESSKTAQDMVDTWQNQADDMARHSDNLERAIALGLKPELVNSFADINQAGNLAAMIANIEYGAEVMEDGSTKISDTAKDLVNDLNDSFQGANLGREDLAHAIAKIQTDFEAGMQYIVDTFESQVKAMDMSTESAINGQATVDGLIQGMENRQGAAAQAANQLGQRVLREMRAALEIRSPSRAMKKIGHFTMDGFTDGMEDRQQKVKNVAEDTADTVQDSFKKAALKQQMLYKSMSAQQKALMEKGAKSVSKAVPDGFDHALTQQKKLKAMSKKTLEAKKDYADSSASFV